MRFMNLVWCDDHILMEPRLVCRMSAAAYSLRRAMILVLGTGACNEKKFTPWARQCKALGLMFDLDTMTVSIPAAKIAQVLGRWLALLALTFVNARYARNLFEKLLEIQSNRVAAMKNPNSTDISTLEAQDLALYQP
jgi:hypothetical protein